MRIENEVQLDFCDVLIKPKRSTLESRKDVNLTRQYVFKSGNEWKGLGIIAANMDTIGTFRMGKALYKHDMLTAIHKHYSVEELVEFFSNPGSENSFYTMGISNSDLEKFNEFCLISNDKRFNHMKVCIDVANGNTQKFIEFVKSFREKNPSVILMAGNVVTPELTEELILSGVDIVKIGIGPGSACTTRRLTGCGYPQLSAIIECADAAHGLGGYIAADGGCTVPGDVAKAFGAGADFVMLGGMLAGHDECAGEIIGTVSVEPTSEVQKSFSTALHCDGYIFRGKTYCALSDLPDEALNKKVSPNAKMKFYGMASSTAMKKYNNIAEHRASEGKTVEVPYKGSVHDTLLEIEGGVRSACTYTGSKSIKELPKRTTFVRVNRQLNNIFGN